MFSYPDAARYRIGPNYQQLPPNRPHSRVYSPYERDGPATINGNYGGDPDYVRSTLHPVALTSHHAMTAAETWHGNVKLHASSVTEKDFEQPRELWRIICDEGGREEFVGNVVGMLGGVEAALVERAVGEFLRRAFWVRVSGLLTC